MPQTILDILRLGFSGLIFLFAALAYRLLSKEQERDKPNEKILKNVRFFALFALALALVAGSFSLAETLLHQDEIISKNRTTIRVCRRNAEHLATIGKISDASTETLSAAIKATTALCLPLLETLDED